MTPAFRGGRRGALLACLAAVVAGGPAAARAGDFVDTRLVFIAGDDDFLHDAGVTWPPSQRPDVGDRPGYDLPWEKRDSSETGRESRTHLVLHKAIEGYFPGLTTEAALVMELNHARILAGDPRAIYDDGTYLRLTQRIGDGAARATLMPFRSDRLRLGYLWDISWGGDHVFPGATTVPGMQVELEQPWFAVYAGAKTARMPFVTGDATGPDAARSGQVEAFWGLFGGVRGGRADDGLRLDVNGGFFEKGRNPRGPVRGERVDAGGASARLAFISGLPFLPTTDTRFYSADPTAPWNAVQYEPDGFDWRLAVEATYLMQILEDPDEAGGTVRDPGLAGAVHGRVQLGYSRVSVLAIYRDLGFLFFDAPGVERYQALPEGQDTTAELVGAISADHHFPGAHLTPGLSLGVQVPASRSNYIPRAGINAPGNLTGRRTAIYRRADMFDDTGLLTAFLVPDGADVLPVFGARATLQLDLAEGFALIGQVTVLHDENRAKLEQDELQVNTVRTFDDPLTFGAAILARAEL